MAIPPDSTRRLRMVIAYDGSPFMGWQSQSGGNTIQDKLEAAFAALCQDGTAAPVGGPASAGPVAPAVGPTPTTDPARAAAAPARIVVHGSGRTDAGVHARGQVAHADLPAPGRMTLERWRGALNAHLPPQIRVESVRWESPNFHARFDARGKVYLYRIWNAPVFHPFEIGRAWHLPGPIDLEILRAGAARLLGEHDFAGFAANRGKPGENTVRTIRRLQIRRRGALLTLEFEGDGFLYKMVRLLTGTLIRCAQGRAPLDWIDRLLAGGKHVMKTNFAAPAEGLYLMRVLYGKAGSSAFSRHE